MKYSSGVTEKKLTKKQTSIVASEKYPQYLRAGAGTGKTEVLVRKIVNILENDSSCLLYTSTERLNGHIGTEKRSRLLREAAVGNIGQWTKV